MFYVVRTERHRRQTPPRPRGAPGGVRPASCRTRSAAHSRSGGGFGQNPGTFHPPSTPPPGESCGRSTGRSRATPGSTTNPPETSSSSGAPTAGCSRTTRGNGRQLWSFSERVRGANDAADHLPAERQSNTSSSYAGGKCARGISARRQTCGCSASTVGSARRKGHPAAGQAA